MLKMLFLMKFFLKKTNPFKKSKADYDTEEDLVALLLKVPILDNFSETKFAINAL